MAKILINSLSILLGLLLILGCILYVQEIRQDAAAESSRSGCSGVDYLDNYRTLRSVPWVFLAIDLFIIICYDVDIEKSEFYNG